MESALFDALRQAMPGMPDHDLPRFAAALSKPGPYAPGPDAQPREGTPRGTLRELRHGGGTAYPGVARALRLYVPASATPRPLGLLVFLDGARYLGPEALAANVLDNLIAAGELPPLAALFVEPGEAGPGLPLFGGAGNRSVEYDSPGRTCADFLVDELIPFATQGLAIDPDPTMHGIVGLSSGGHCALNAAVERPDVFRKVASHCGSFVDIRGGHALASRIRREPPKALRVFLQTGEHDLDITFGHWLLANRTMAAALAYVGCEHRLEVGEGGHSLAHGGALLPDTLRWLWRDG